MFSKKEKNTLFALDIVESILSVIAIVIFTLIFRLDTSDIRYVFLLGDCYVIYSFAKTLSSLETKIEKFFLKKKATAVDPKCVEKLSV